MNLTVTRTVFTDVSTCGLMYVDNELECMTLELPRKDGLHGSCIPNGIFKVVLSHSPKFSDDVKFVALCKKLKCESLMPEVLNVPKRDEIRIHWGNTAADTEGCILVGKTHQKDFIGESRDAFAELYEKLELAWQSKEDIMLEVKDVESQ